MKYEIVPLGQDAIKIANKIFSKIEVANTIIVQIPNEYIPSADTYIEELQKALPEKNIVITSVNIKFCELKRKK